MPFVGRPKKTPQYMAPSNAVEKQAEEKSHYVAEVYVNRRKVGEHRAATEQEAFAAAKQDKQKFPGARVSIIMREAPRNERKAHIPSAPPAGA